MSEGATITLYKESDGYLVIVSDPETGDSSSAGSMTQAEGIQWALAWLNINVKIYAGGGIA